jgi:uncharacterized membrane protein
MKSFVFYILLSLAILAASLFIHWLPASKQGAWLMAALFAVAVWFLVRICKG